MSRRYYLISKKDILLCGLLSFTCGLGGICVGLNSIKQPKHGKHGKNGKSIIGERGFQGLMGSSIVGSQGPSGINGTQGFGFQGIMGTQGFGLQGNQGYQGIFGLQGLIGLQGFQGIGNQGPQGLVGFQGLIGLQGLQGLDLTTVPDVVGESRIQAEENIVNAGLNFTETYVTGSTTNVVETQDPAGGTITVTGSTVELVIAEPTVPDVVGDTVSEAETTLENDGFLNISVVYETGSPSGTVLAQDPTGGTQYPQASQITLYVAQ